eukprot:gene38760-52349_t
MREPIDRRTMLRSGAAAGAVLALPATALAATPTHDPKLAALFDALFLESVRQRPESATLLGLDTGQNADLRSKLSDTSETGRAAARALTASQIKRLLAVDRTALSPADRLDYDVVLYARRATAAADRFDYAGAPYVISQQNGAYQATPDFLDTKHPLNSAGDAEAWLSRLAAFAGQLDANTTRFTRDAAANVLPADFLLDLTLTQLAKLKVPATDARLIQSFAARARAKGLPDSFAARAAALHNAQILPALTRQFDAVTAARAHATHDAGVWKLKDGDAFYRMALLLSTDRPGAPHERLSDREFLILRLIASGKPVGHIARELSLS